MLAAMYPAAFAIATAANSRSGIALRRLAIGDGDLDMFDVAARASAQGIAGRQGTDALPGRQLVTT